MKFEEIKEELENSKKKHINKPEDLSLERIFHNLLGNHELKCKEFVEKDFNHLTWIYESANLRVSDSWIDHDRNDVHKYTRILIFINNNGEKITATLIR